MHTHALIRCIQAVHTPSIHATCISFEFIALHLDSLLCNFREIARCVCVQFSGGGVGGGGGGGGGSSGGLSLSFSRQTSPSLSLSRSLSLSVQIALLGYAAERCVRALPKVSGYACGVNVAPPFMSHVYSSKFTGVTACVCARVRARVWTHTHSFAEYYVKFIGARSKAKRFHLFGRLWNGVPAACLLILICHQFVTCCKTVAERKFPIFALPQQSISLIIDFDLL